MHVADLVIGGRRHGSHRSLRGVVIAGALVAVAAIAAYFIYRRLVSYAEPSGELPHAALDVDPQQRQALRYGPASLTYRGELPVLRLSGEPFALGAAHGRLAADDVARVATSIEPTIAATVRREGWFAGFTYPARLRWQHRYADDGIPGHQLMEVAAIVRGAAASRAAPPSYQTLLRQQTALDVGVPAPWSSGAALHALSRSLSFITPLRGTSGERLVIGRSFGLPGAGDGGDAARQNLTVSFVHADKVIPYASVGWPGLIGVVSAINAEGIAIMVHPVRTSDVELGKTGQPVTLLARDVVENARSLADAIGVLREAKPLGAAIFVVVDGNARTWAVVERSPRHVTVREPKAPVVVGDLLTSAAFKDDPINDRTGRTRPLTMRLERLRTLLKESPPMELADAVAILRDHRGAGNASLPLGHRGAVRDVAAVQTALFDTSAMVLYVAEGGDAAGRFRAFDLRHELRGEGSRAAPPADVLAATEDAAEGLATASARAELRAARRARARGDGNAAREHVSRALARAPELPEALLLAGHLARQRGDNDAARDYFERYLAGGADDLGAELEVRALLDTL